MRGVHITIKDFKLNLISAAFNVGNIAKIEINGKDYALNKRGFNIVTIDCQNNQVCYSACIDMHINPHEFLSKIIK